MTTTTETPPTDTPGDTTEDVSRAKTAAFRRRSRAMSETTRAKRLADYPNPDTMNIDKLLADARAEAASIGSNSRMLNILGEIDVETPSMGRQHLTARYPQWDETAQEYNAFARNPDLPDDLTDVPTARVLATIGRYLRSYPQHTGSVENVLAGQYVTWTDTRPGATVTLTMTFTADQINAYGYDITPDLGENDLKYRMAILTRNRLRDDPYSIGVVLNPPATPAVES